MEMKMLNLETGTVNKELKQNHTLIRLDTQTVILASTLFRKATAKNEIKISRQLHYELTRLYKDSLLKKPGWLRCTFQIDQRRRKNLNTRLYEAGLDSNWCGHCCDASDWSGMLHVFWHELNGRPKCL